MFLNCCLRPANSGELVPLAMKVSENITTTLQSTPPTGQFSALATPVGISNSDKPRQAAVITMEKGREHIAVPWPQRQTAGMLGCDGQQ